MNARLEIPGNKIAIVPDRGPADQPRRILVVEDETDAPALHAVRHDPGSYQLLITDNHLPKLPGLQLIRKLRAARRAMPVILATGALPMNIDWLQLAATLEKSSAESKLPETVKAVLRGTGGDSGQRAPSLPSKPAGGHGLSC